MMDDTISAIATALGVGSIGVIRVSGPDSLAIVRRFFAGREQPGRENARKLLYGHILDGKGQVVDEVLAVYMPGPIPIREKMFVRSSATGAGKPSRKS